MKVPACTGVCANSDLEIFDWKPRLRAAWIEHDACSPIGCGNPHTRSLVGGGTQWVSGVMGVKLMKKPINTSL